jgi:prefoldin subunit 5
MDYTREAERFIKQYNIWQAEISDIDYKIAELHEQDGVGSIDTTKDPISKTYKFSSITENLGVTIADKVYLLEQRKKHLERLLQRIDNAINALSEDEKEIITRSVIKGESYYQFTYKL